MVKHGFGTSVLAICCVIALTQQSCTKTLSPEEKQTVSKLQDDLKRIRHEVEEASQEDGAYSGGLIKALIETRIQILKINAALVEQRINAIEGHANLNVVVTTAKPDLTRAQSLAKEIEAQKQKIAEGRAEADRFSGGLVQAMAEAAVATERNTLAMMEQEYFAAQYGLALPAVSQATRQVTTSVTAAAEAASTSKTLTTSATPNEPRVKDCLKIANYDSSVLSKNDVYTEVARKVDIANSCNQPFDVRANFTLYDKDDFQLDTDDENVMVPAQGTGKARGKMLVSPPEKASRIAKQGASLTLRGRSSDN